MLALRDEAAPAPDSTPLLVTAMQAGRRTIEAGLDAAHATFEEQWAAMPSALKDLTHPPAYPVEPSDALQHLTAAVDAAHAHQTEDA